MIEVKQVADDADVIVNGYAYKLTDNIIHVFNLNNPGLSAVLDLDGNLLETNMSDIEIGIVERIYTQNKEFIEV